MLAAASGALFAYALVATAAAAAPTAPDMQGFSQSGAAEEAQLEQRFDSDLSAAELRSWMQQMSSAANNVGSAHDKSNAEFQLKMLREWGWDAVIETFSVLYPTPR
jgi:N-acetylated-alpha-linked acidic dipeptidase